MTWISLMIRLTHSHFSWDRGESSLCTVPVLRSPPDPSSPSSLSQRYYRTEIEEFLFVLFKGFGYPQKGPIEIWEDNSSCILMSATLSYRDRSRHVDVKVHFLRDSVYWRGCDFYSDKCTSACVGRFHQDFPMQTALEEHKGYIILRKTCRHRRSELWRRHDFRNVHDWKVWSMLQGLDVFHGVFMLAWPSAGCLTQHTLFSWLPLVF